MTSGARRKRILYHGPSVEQFRRLLADLEAGGGVAPGDLGDPAIAHDGLTSTFVFEPDVGALIADIARKFVNLLVLDVRCEEADQAAHARRALAILDALDDAKDVEDRYAFDHIVALVPGSPTPLTDDLLLKLGGRGVRHVLRHASYQPGASVDAEWGGQLLRETWKVLRERRTGKRALCAAGGGITGIFFELGAMKCLDDCMDLGGVNGFDMYFGISAGAVVSAPIAAGYSVDEYMAAIAGVSGGRIPPLDLRLFRMHHLDVPGFVRRSGLAAKTAWGGLRGLLGAGREVTRDGLLFDYADLVAPPFRADRFEELMCTVLTADGATNDFRRLRRPLYIGATDQDARTHVLFGDEENDAVPISQAVQASMSINPAFSAKSIGGRYYEDGAVTRTSNFVEAMRRGATLIFVLDPFLPYVARTPGFNNRRGVLYNVDQDIRTISYTRYETTLSSVLRAHPDVSTYTFLPANRQRRLISHNPMDHRPYLEIWRGAYLSTLNRLHHLRHRLEGDLAQHGVQLDLERAEAVGSRLEASQTLRFEDFFPDGVVRIRRPPMVGEDAPG